MAWAWAWRADRVAINQSINNSHRRHGGRERKGSGGAGPRGTEDGQGAKEPGGDALGWGEGQESRGEAKNKAKKAPRDPKIAAKKDPRLRPREGTKKRPRGAVPRTKNSQGNGPSQEGGAPPSTRQGWSQERTRTGAFLPRRNSSTTDNVSLSFDFAPCLRVVKRLWFKEACLPRFSNPLPSSNRGDNPRRWARNTLRNGLQSDQENL